MSPMRYLGAADVSVDARVVDAAGTPHDAQCQFRRWNSPGQGFSVVGPITGFDHVPFLDFVGVHDPNHSYTCSVSVSNVVIGTTGAGVADKDSILLTIGLFAAGVESGSVVVGVPMGGQNLRIGVVRTDGIVWSSDSLGNVNVTAWSAAPTVVRHLTVMYDTQRHDADRVVLYYHTDTQTPVRISHLHGIDPRLAAPVDPKVFLATSGWCASAGWDSRFDLCPMTPRSFAFQSGAVILPAGADPVGSVVGTLADVNEGHDLVRFPAVVGAGETLRVLVTLLDRVVDVVTEVRVSSAPLGEADPFSSDSSAGSLMTLDGDAWVIDGTDLAAMAAVGDVVWYRVTAGTAGEYAGSGIVYVGGAAARVYVGAPSAFTTVLGSSSIGSDRVSARVTSVSDASMASLAGSVVVTGYTATSVVLEHAGGVVYPVEPFPSFAVDLSTGSVSMSDQVFTGLPDGTVFTNVRATVRNPLGQSATLTHTLPSPVSTLDGTPPVAAVEVAVSATGQTVVEAVLCTFDVTSDHESFVMANLTAAPVNASIEFYVSLFDGAVAAYTSTSRTADAAVADPRTVALTDLTPDTDYYVHYFLKDGAGNRVGGSVGPVRTLAPVAAPGAVDPPTFAMVSSAKGFFLDGVSDGVQTVDGGLASVTTGTAATVSAWTRAQPTSSALTSEAVTLTSQAPGGWVTPSSIVYGACVHPTSGDVAIATATNLAIYSGSSILTLSNLTTSPSVDPEGFYAFTGPLGLTQRIKASSEYSDRPPWMVFDGLTTWTQMVAANRIGWLSLEVPVAHLIVDLGAVYPITSITYFGYGESGSGSRWPQSYAYFASADGVTWGTAFATASGLTNGLNAEVRRDQYVTTRYLKLEYTAMNAVGCVGINELVIRGVAAGGAVAPSYGRNSISASINRLSKIIPNVTGGAAGGPAFAGVYTESTGVQRMIVADSLTSGAATDALGTGSTDCIAKVDIDSAGNVYYLAYTNATNTTFQIGRFLAPTKVGTPPAITLGTKTTAFLPYTAQGTGGDVTYMDLCVAGSGSQESLYVAMSAVNTLDISNQRALHRFALPSRHLTLNGTSQFATGASVMQSLRTQPFTWSVWFNWSGSTNVRMLITNGSETDTTKLNFARDIGLYVASGFVRFESWGNGTVGDFSVAIPSNTWVHMVAINRVTDRVLFINGTKYTGAAFAGSYSGTDVFSIGQTYAYQNPLNSGGESYFFNGSVDEVGIYNAALTDADVAKMYAGGLGFDQRSGGLSVPSSALQAYWRMDTAQGNLLLDSSGNNRHLTHYTTDRTTPSVPNLVLHLTGTYVGSTTGSVSAGVPHVLSKYGSAHVLGFNHATAVVSVFDLDLNIVATVPVRFTDNASGVTTACAPSRFFVFADKNVFFLTLPNDNTAMFWFDGCGTCHQVGRTYISSSVGASRSFYSSYAIAAAGGELCVVGPNTSGVLRREPLTGPVSNLWTLGTGAAARTVGINRFGATMARYRTAAGGVEDVYSPQWDAARWAHVALTEPAASSILTNAGYLACTGTGGGDSAATFGGATLSGMAVAAWARGGFARFVGSLVKSAGTLALGAGTSSGLGSSSVVASVYSSVQDAMIECAPYPTGRADRGWRHFSGSVDPTSGSLVTYADGKVVSSADASADHVPHLLRMPLSASAAADESGFSNLLHSTASQYATFQTHMGRPCVKFVRDIMIHSPIIAVAYGDSTNQGTVLNRMARESHGLGMWIKPKEDFVYFNMNQMYTIGTRTTRGSYWFCRILNSYDGGGPGFSLTMLANGAGNTKGLYLMCNGVRGGNVDITSTQLAEDCIFAETSVSGLDQNWMHVFIRVNPHDRTYELFVNGISYGLLRTKRDRSTFLPTVTTTMERYRIGMGDGESFEGYYSDFRIFDRWVSDSQVRNLYVGNRVVAHAPLTRSVGTAFTQSTSYGLALNTASASPAFLTKDGRDCALLQPPSNVNAANFTATTNNANNPYFQGSNLFLTNNMTVSVWFNISSSANSYATPVDLGNFTKAGNLLVGRNNGANQLRVGRGVLGSVLSGGSGVLIDTSLGALHNVVFGVENGFLRYVIQDGNVYVANANIDVGTNNSTFLRVGCLAESGIGFDPMFGTVDDLAIWNSYLPIDQAQALYGTGAPWNVRHLSPTAYWQFESYQMSGNTMLDQSGNGNHLTFYVNGAPASPGLVSTSALYKQATRLDVSPKPYLAIAAGTGAHGYGLWFKPAEPSVYYDMAVTYTAPFGQTNRTGYAMPSTILSTGAGTGTGFALKRLSNGGTDRGLYLMTNGVGSTAAQRVFVETATSGLDQVWNHMYVRASPPSSVTRNVGQFGTVRATVNYQWNNEWTCSLWVKRIDSTNIYFVDTWSGITHPIRIYWHPIDGMKVAVLNTGNISYAFYDRRSLDTNWHHVAVTYKATVYTMYVDGQPSTVTTEGTAPTFDTVRTSFFLGNAWDGSQTCGYYMQDFAIHNVALDAATVNRVYNAGNPLNLLEDSTNANLQVYFPFRQNATDTKGNATTWLNGTLPTFTSQSVLQADGSYDLFVNGVLRGSVTGLASTFVPASTGSTAALTLGEADTAGVYGYVSNFVASNRRVTDVEVAAMAAGLPAAGAVAAGGSVIQLGADGYVGDIDEAAVWKTSLSADAIRVIYRARPSLAAAHGSYRSHGGLEGYWRFEDSADLGKDSSSKSNALTVVSGTRATSSPPFATQSPMTLYVNGSAMSTPRSAAAMLPNGPAAFGVGDTRITADMDDLCVWSSELRDSELAAIAGSGGASFDVSANSGSYTSSAALKHRWTFEGGSLIDTVGSVSLGNTVANVEDSKLDLVSRGTAVMAVKSTGVRRIAITNSGVTNDHNYVQIVQAIWNPCTNKVIELFQMSKTNVGKDYTVHTCEESYTGLPISTQRLLYTFPTTTTMNSSQGKFLAVNSQNIVFVVGMRNNGGTLTYGLLDGTTMASLITFPSTLYTAAQMLPPVGVSTLNTNVNAHNTFVYAFGETFFIVRHIAYYGILVQSMTVSSTGILIRGPEILVAPCSNTIGFVYRRFGPVVSGSKLVIPWFDSSEARAKYRIFDMSSQTFDGPAVTTPALPTNAARPVSFAWMGEYGTYAVTFNDDFGDGTLRYPKIMVVKAADQSVVATMWIGNRTLQYTYDTDTSVIAVSGRYVVEQWYSTNTVRLQHWAYVYSPFGVETGSFDTGLTWEGGTSHTVIPERNYWVRGSGNEDIANSHTVRFEYFQIRR